MSVIRRLSRLVQIDLDAYFLFRDELRGSKVNVEESGGSEPGFTFSVLDGAVDDPGKVEALGHLMLAGGFVTGDIEKAESMIGQRLRNGDACAIAWDGDRAVGLAWIAGQGSDIRRRFARCAERISGAAVLYQAYVGTEYRGRRLHIQLDRTRKEYLRLSGVTQTLTFVGVKNFASVRNSMRVNDQYKLIYHLAVKGPKGMTRNFYPKWAGEPWTPCRKELPIHKQG